MKKITSKSFWIKFWIRISTAYRILFIYKHWFIFVLEKKDLIAVIAEQPFEVTIVRHGMQKYQEKWVVNKAFSDEETMVLEKALFEARVDEWREENGV